MSLRVAAMLVLALAACDDRARDRTSKGGEDMLGVVAIEDCASPETLDVLACWDVPADSCWLAATSCESILDPSGPAPSAAVVACLDAAGVGLTGPEPNALDCYDLRDKAALLRAYRACGQSFDSREWVVDASALGGYLMTYCH